MLRHEWHCFGQALLFTMLYCLNIIVRDRWQPAHRQPARPVSLVITFVVYKPRDSNISLYVCKRMFFFTTGCLTLLFIVDFFTVHFIFSPLHTKYICIVIWIWRNFFCQWFILRPIGLPSLSLPLSWTLSKDKYLLLFWICIFYWNPFTNGRFSG